MATNLRSKINHQFVDFTIKVPNPKQDHPWHLQHLHADFIELLALLWDRESFLTLQQAITYYKDYDISIDFDEANLLRNMESSSVAEKNDKWVERFTNIFFYSRRTILDF